MGSQPSRKIIHYNAPDRINNDLIPPNHSIMNHLTSGELGEQMLIKYSDSDTLQGGADPRTAMTNTVQQQRQQQQQEQQLPSNDEATASELKTEQQPKQETKTQLLAINLCLQQLQQHQKLQQHPIDQTQLLQIIQQQQDIFTTIFSIAEDIRFHLLKQNLPLLPHLQRPKPRQLVIQETHKLNNQLLELNKEQLDML